MKFLIILAVVLATGCSTVYKVNPRTGEIFVSSVRKFGEFNGNRCVTEPVTADARCETTEQGEVCYGMKKTCTNINAAGVDRQKASPLEEAIAGAIAPKLQEAFNQ